MLEGFARFCRLREVQTSSGLPVISKKLQDILQSDDFNEEEYDKAMESLFDDGYYEVGRHSSDSSMPKYSHAVPSHCHQTLNHVHHLKIHA